MKSLLIVITLLLTFSKAFAEDSPFYPIGKKDYVQVIQAKTSLEDFRDANKTVIVQFSAEWCGPCIRFWPELFTLNQLKPDAYIIKVVDGTTSWDDIKQIASSGGVNVSGIPYMVVLEPGQSGIKYEGNSFNTISNLLSDQGIQSQDFKDEVTKSINDYNNSVSK